MSQESQQEPTGNTKSVGSSHQLYRWCCTIKEDAISLSQLSQTLHEYAKQFTFQLEEGDGGYRHWQICFSLKRKERFSTVKNLFPRSAHLEGCQDWYAARAYCRKDDTRVSGPYSDEQPMVKTIVTLHAWQHGLLDDIREEPDDRKVIWYTDLAGGAGKSAFTKYMVVHHEALALNNAKSSDVAFALASRKKSPRCVIFNFTRSSDGRLNYAVIEAIKDGLIFSGKYESRTLVFDAPHVICFANFDPDETQLSRDRWDIRTL